MCTDSEIACDFAIIAQFNYRLKCQLQSCWKCILWRKKKMVFVRYRRSRYRNWKDANDKLNNARCEKNAFLIGHDKIKLNEIYVRCTVVWAWSKLTWNSLYGSCISTFNICISIFPSLIPYWSCPMLPTQFAIVYFIVMGNGNEIIFIVRS